jgi:hypothetical protein
MSSVWELEKIPRLQAKTSVGPTGPEMGMFRSLSKVPRLNGSHTLGHGICSQYLRKLDSSG